MECLPTGYRRPAASGQPSQTTVRRSDRRLIDPALAGTDRERVRLALEAADIEARPLWKPLHLQPVFAGCRTIGGAVSTGLFERGLCLPSGSGMTEGEVERVVGVVRGCWKG